MSTDPTSTQGAPRPTASIGGVMSLLGRVLAGGLVVAAGLGGWVAVEKFDIAIPVSGNGSTASATALPTLGDGLPSARIQSPAPWRQFSLTYQSGAQTNRFWIDLDSWQLRIESSGADSDTAVEIQGDRSFTRDSGGGEWFEQDVQSTRDITAWLMADIGPYVLTDLVPPQTLGFTTLELEGTSRGERVYEVAVDAATLQEQHPLAHQRWVDAVRLVGDTTGTYRIRVREDGYIVRIDGEAASVQWDDLIGGVVFFSPLDEGTRVAAAPVAPAEAVPAAPAAPAAGGESPADAPVGD
jgi:hypothetical protein